MQCLHVSMQETPETESAATLGTWEENFALHLEGAPSESLAHRVGLWCMPALKCTLGQAFTWAFMGKALQDKPAPNLHTELHCSAPTGKHTQGEHQRYFATYRYARIIFEIKFALNTKLNWLEWCCKNDPQKYSDLLEGFSENKRLKPVLFQNE